MSKLSQRGLVLAYKNLTYIVFKLWQFICFFFLNIKLLTSEIIVYLRYHMRLKTTFKNKVIRPIRGIDEKRIFNPSKYRGIYKELRFDLEGEIEKLRDEWTRE